MRGSVALRDIAASRTVCSVSGAVCNVQKWRPTKELQLVEATDDHWAWLCGEQPRPGDLLLPEGGVDALPTLDNLRRLTCALRDAGSAHSYLIAYGNEIVGLCGYKHPPRPDGSVEIGFGIAPARRKSGYATRAVGLLLEKARADRGVKTIFAETHVDNHASQGVLRRNGFTVTGRRHDDAEGDMIVWSVPTSL
jgi:RimJ/RimL family protein N-acetyltransferase